MSECTPACTKPAEICMDCHEAETSKMLRTIGELKDAIESNAKEMALSCKAMKAASATIAELSDALRKERFRGTPSGN